LAITAIIGSTPMNKGLFIAAIVIAGSDILATLFTVLYQRFWYEKILRPRYAKGYSPRCSIIVPCKGIPKNFGKNLEGFLELDYLNYEVIYVAETETDPAVPLIRSIIERHRNASLVIAGLSTACAQKNYNLVAGVKKAHDPEVYVFADSDIKPGKQWLTQLVLPLSNAKVAVTSGYRWLHATKGSFGEQAHVYANVFIYVLFCTASFIGGVGLWGGSMAIRRREFEDLAVVEKWSRTAVDDMSLSQLITKKRLNGVVVPESMTHSDDLLPTARATIAWFERQTMFLKSYFKALWFFGGILITSSALLLLVLLPFAALASISGNRTFFGSGGGAASLFYIGEFIAVLMYPLIGPMPRFKSFLLYMPLIRVTQGISYFKTHFTNVITWAGVRYYVAFSGDVSRVERPNPAKPENSKHIERFCG
jgi:ceramide glucosyltransferase